MKFRIRFNKSRGQPGRGTEEHVWRVFAEKKEYLAKHVEIDVPSRSEKEERSEDWNIVCEGAMVIDRDTSTIKIVDSTI
jgi:hypothetical protein